MLFRSIQLCAAASLVTATNLFVASYAGNITTLSLTEQDGSYSLEPTYYNDGCAPNPAWLTLDPNHGTLYCLDEGLSTVNGTLSSFTINPSGSLSLVQTGEIVGGAVSSIIYGDPATGKRAIAIAHYGGSAVSDFTLDPTHKAAFKANQAIHYNLTKPGPNAVRQAAPHVHEVILDPTGKFVLAPDLGADLVRVFSIDPTTLRLTAVAPLQIEAGAGPRHAAFWQPYSVTGGNSVSYLFVVTELSNQVFSYKVTYPKAGGLAFEQVYRTSTYGPDLIVPDGNAAAEIVVSPDNRFLIVSNRNNTSFTLPAPPSSSSSSNTTSSNATTIPSDSLSTFKLNHDGTLTFTQLWPAGGLFPRHFSLNKAGDLLAVGLQTVERVVVLSRDIVSGNIGRPIAEVRVAGNVSFVGWHE